MNISDLLNLSENELFLELAKESSSMSSLGSFNINWKQGKLIFDNLHDELYEIICKKYNICEKINDPSLSDRLTLVTTIADIISAANLGVPAFTLSALIVKIGISGFCGCK